MEPQTPSPPSDPLVSSAVGPRSFGHYSQFLRAAMADEESLQLREALHTLAAQVERIALLLRAPVVDRAAVARGLMDLLDLLRDYRHLVQEMGEDWHASYEFKAHFRALTQFRGQVTRWANEAGPRSLPPEPAEFELSAWRLLGAGALLLDAYEQTEPKPGASEGHESAAESPSWWGRLLTVLHFRP